MDAKKVENAEEIIPGIMQEHLQEWTSDILQHYLSGENYNCTFLVGGTEHRNKTFKCHKLILSTASPVFKAALFGNFKESKNEPDDPIKIDHFSPSAFHAVMLFIYGKEILIPKSLKLSLEIYRFAHHFQIKQLVEIYASLCFKFDLAPVDLCHLYETFQLLENEPKQQQIMKIIQGRCGEVLANEDFLRAASQNTMKDILQQEVLNIMSETCLFLAVVHWGELHAGIKVLDNSDDDIEKLRKNVMSLVHLIRFRSLSVTKFAEDCHHYMEFNALTLKERLHILSCLCLDKCDDLWPQDFSTSKETRMLFMEPRKVASFKVQSHKVVRSNVILDPLSFHFQVNKNVYLLGLNLFSTDSLNDGKEIRVECVLKHQEKILCTASDGFRKTKEEEDGQQAIKKVALDNQIEFQWPTLLQANVEYVIYVYHMNLEERDAAELTFLENATSTAGDTLKVSVVAGAVLGDVYKLHFANERPLKN